MGAVHYATNIRLTARGLSTDFAIHTHEPKTVTRCNQCLVAAGEMEGCAGGCGDAHECGCFGSGWAAGKDKAHLEIRTILERNHAVNAGDCGCEPCITVRTSAAALASDRHQV